MAKTLIIYYSRKGENYWNGSIKTIAKGNTERVAEFIQYTVAVTCSRWRLTASTAKAI